MFASYTRTPRYVSRYRTNKSEGMCLAPAKLKYPTSSSQVVLILGLKFEIKLS